MVRATVKAAFAVTNLSIAINALSIPRNGFVTPRRPQLPGSNTDLAVPRLQRSFLPSSSSPNESPIETKPWWTNVEMEHGDLATSVIADFPILSTTVPPTNDDDEDPSTPPPKPLIYFDSAATSQKPLVVTNALTSYYQTSNSNVHRGAHSLSRRATESYEAARDKLASFIHAYSRDEIVFTSGATEALNLVAATYGRANLTPGDEVLITELEHHSNIVPWQIVTQQTGAVLRYIPLNPTTGQLDTDALPNLLSNRTKIVALQHVSNVMGSVTPLPQIIPLIRALSHPTVKIVLDACQSLPHQPINVQSLGVDFIAASGHKMCGPTGIGFLWGHKSVLDAMPPYMGGGEMIEDVSMERSTYAPSPGRFEAGTPRIAQAIGLGAAVDYLSEIGMSRIQSYERELGRYMYQRIREIGGVTVLGPVEEEERQTAIVAFVVEGVHPSDLGTFLDMEGVAVRAGHHCCQPLHKKLGISHSARASLYFYNTKEEVDVFISKLEEIVAMLSGGGLGAGGDDEDEEFVPFF